MSTPYLSKALNGTYRYRRGVPEELRDALGVREIKKSLGKDLTKAMQRYAEVHREAEKALEAARLQERPSLRDEVLQVLRKHKVPQGILQRIDAAEDGLDPDNPRDLDLMIGLDALQQELIEDYEDAERQGVDPKVSLEAIRAIGAPRVPPHTYTVAGALDFYVREKRGEDEAKNKQRENRVTSLKKRMIRILGEDAIVRRSLERMTREDALKVRDGLLGEGLDPASVRKMIGIAKAAINLTIVEFDLDIKNRFEKLNIKDSGHTRGKRDSLTEEDLALVDPVMDRRIGDPLSAIWVTLRDTGARPEEVIRRRVKDVHLEKEYLSITDGKTQNAIREVPLSPAALQALVPFVDGKDPEAFVFPSYAEGRGPDSASQSLMKRFRRKIKDPKKVVRSLRHRMADRLRDVDCPEDIREEIQGWSSQKVAKNYGRGYSLDMKRKYLSRVWNGVDVENSPEAS